jgi:SAM-dependent methyltransferase
MDYLNVGGPMIDQLHKTPSVAMQRAQVRATYDGARGALLATASALSGNLASAERLFRDHIFDLRGLTTILDVGSGAAQLTLPMLKYADPKVQIVCSDLSPKMLRRAKARVRNHRPHYVSCDVERLPFGNESFDGVTCGFVLEHLPDPRDGLAEIVRVMRPGGRLMILIMIESLLSTFTAKLWHCRTLAPKQLIIASSRLGLDVHSFTRLDGWQRLVRGDGLAVVLQKRRSFKDGARKVRS